MYFVTETIKAIQWQSGNQRGPEVTSGVTSLSLYLDLLHFYQNHYLKTRLQNIPASLKDKQAFFCGLVRMEGGGRRNEEV